MENFYNKKKNEFNETLIRIKNCDDMELQAWKDQIDEDATYYGEVHNNATYNAIKRELEKRRQEKIRLNNKQNKVEQTVRELINSLIKRGYSVEDLKNFFVTGENICDSYQDETGKEKKQ